jgi:hypothetical protein
MMFLSILQGTLNKPLAIKNLENWEVGFLICYFLHGSMTFCFNFLTFIVNQADNRMLEFQLPTFGIREVGKSVLQLQVLRAHFSGGVL